MKKKFSRYLEDKDKVILKRERRVIVSEGVDNEDKKESDENEEEEYWDYVDGGQSMEELDRLEKMEQKIEKLTETFKILKPKAISFQNWKKKAQKKEPETDDTKTVKPVIDLEEKTKKKISKINIIDRISDIKNIDLLGQNYVLGLNKDIINKVEFPKMIPYSPMIDLSGKKSKKVLIEYNVRPLEKNKLRENSDKNNTFTINKETNEFLQDVGFNYNKYNYTEKPEIHKEIEIDSDFVKKILPTSKANLKLPFLFEDYTLKLPELNLSLKANQKEKYKLEPNLEEPIKSDISKEKKAI